MKTSYKAALLAALGLAVVSGAQAQEMFLGLTDTGSSASAQNDYVLDLGSYTQFTTSASLNGTLSASSISAAFGSVDANYLNNVSVGAVAGASSPTKFVDQTVGFTAGLSASGIGTAGGLMTTFATGEYPASGNSTVPSTQTWSYNVAVDPNNIGLASSSGGQSVSGNTGNMMAYLNNGNISEILYSAVVGGTVRNPTVTESTLGTLTVDLNSDTWSFQGAATSVPEPSTYGLIAGAGLLLVGVRRQFTRKNA